MSKAFYKLMRDLTDSKRKIEADHKNHTPGFLRGFELAGKMVWKHREDFHTCSDKPTSNGSETDG